MNNFNKRIRKIIILIIIITSIISFGFMIKGFLCLFWNCEYIDKQQAITWIIIPMICALVWVCIPIAMDNSLSNERLKISLNRLEWRWRNYCKDEKWSQKDGSYSLNFDKEYKFIVQNRWKSHKEILSLMFDDYRDNKYYFYKKQVWDGTKMTKIEFLKDWIEDHFIY